MIVNGNSGYLTPLIFKKHEPNVNLNHQTKVISSVAAIQNPVNLGKVLTFVGKKIKDTLEKPLTLIYMADTHKSLELMPNLKTAINSNKKDPENSLVVHAGDYSMGTEGIELQVELLNKLGINLATLGNHEFYSGTEKLAQTLKNSAFQTVVSNLDFTKINALSELFNTNKLVKSTIKEFNGEKYGIIGALTASVNDKAYEKFRNGTYIADTIKTLSNEVKNLEKQGVNRIILISHLGYTNDKEVAKKVPGIDVIVGGHSHIALAGIKKNLNLMESPRNSEPVLILHSGAYAEGLGVSELVFNDKGILQVKPDDSAQIKITVLEGMQDEFDIMHKKLSIEPAATTKNTLINVEDYPKDKELAEIVKKEQSSMHLITTLNNNINGEWPKWGVSPMGSLVAGSLREYTDSQIALIQSGCIRRSIKKGPLFEEYINNYVLPFNTPIVKVELRGEDLLAALNKGAYTAGKFLKPGILQTSGLKYTIDMKRDRNFRVIPEEVLIKTGETYEPLKLNKTYTVAYDKYLLTGGDVFTSLQKGTLIKEYENDNYATVLVKHIKNLVNNNKPITPQFTDTILYKNRDDEEAIYNKLFYLFGIKKESKVNRYVFKG